MTSVKGTGKQRGAPRRLNAQLAAGIIQTLLGGAYVETACDYVGITSTTYRDWRVRGQLEMDRVSLLGYDSQDVVASSAIFINEDGKQQSVSLKDMMANCPEPFKPFEWDFVVFLHQTGKAIASAEIRNLTIIQTAAPTQWTAAAWILERTHKERYSRDNRIALEGVQNGSPISVEMVTADQLESKLAEIRAEDG